jgi:hypothetical protein
MKKRSAMMIAAALVTALLAGTAALSLGMAGPSTTSASSRPLEPRVRTIERTVTIHREAAVNRPPVPGTVVASGPASSSVRGGDESEGAEFEGEDD